MRRSERVIQTRATRELIASSPTTIRFRRTKRQPKSNGGVELVDLGFVEPQQVFLSKERAGGKGSTTTAGVMDRQWTRLVALPDADIQAGDTFTVDSVEYEVGHTVKKDYEVFAAIHPRGNNADR